MKTVTDLLRGREKVVWSVEPDAPVYKALEIMAERDVGALVVLYGAELVGVISERDYARKIALVGRASQQTKVKQIMSTRVFCVRPEVSVEECMALMTQQHVRHLPVVVDKRAVGMISIGDVVKAVVSDKEFIIDQLSRYIYGVA